MILAGDFNTTEDKEPYRILATSGWQDSYRMIRPQKLSDEASFHGFKGTTAGSRIDFIFASPALEIVNSEILREKAEKGVYSSDHYPITAVLRVK